MKIRAAAPALLLALSLLLSAGCAARQAAPEESAGPAPTDRTAAPSETNGVGSPAGEWSAWLDRMPPGPATLHVQGEVVAPTPGYVAKLAPKEPQGINPNDLILALTLEEKGGIWTQVLTPVSASYVVDDPKIAYDTVTVLFPDGTSRTLNVETTH